MGWVLRRLENKEIFVNRRGTAENFILSFHIEAKVDLFKNIEVVKNAIRSWKQTHQLLQAKVALINNEYFFVIDDGGDSNTSLTNVYFLRSNIDREPSYDLIVEKCFVDLIDFEKPHDFLWRLLVVQMKPNEYEIIWQLHHVIGDGISAASNLLLLISMIEKCLNNTTIEAVVFDLYPGTELLFEKEKNLITTRMVVPVVRRPEFVDPDRAKNNSDHNSWEDSYDLVQVDSGNIYATYDQLARISRESSSCKPKRFIIPKHQTTQLLTKCKRSGVKVTTFINMISCVSFLRLYSKFGSTVDELVYNTAINLRQFRDESVIGRFELGYCVGSLMSVFKNEFEDVTDDVEISAKFWNAARVNEASFRDRVENDYEKFAPVMNQIGEGELHFHFGTSNIGIIEEKESRLFRVQYGFLLSSISSWLQTRFVYNSICTVDGQICWSFSYNSHFIDNSIIDELILIIKRVLNLVLG